MILKNKVLYIYIFTNTVQKLATLFNEKNVWFSFLIWLPENGLLYEGCLFKAEKGLLP